MTQPPTQEQVERIVAGLSKAQRRSVLYLSGDWQAGPDLPGYVITDLDDLRRKGLIDRQFGDDGLPKYSGSASGIQVRLSACWHFILNDRGIAVRQAITKGSDQ